MMAEVVNIRWVTTDGGLPLWIEVTMSNGQVRRYEGFLK